MDILQLKKKSAWVRRQVLEMIVSAGKGHIGGAFSCADILTVLYYADVLRFKSHHPEWPDPAHRRPQTVTRLAERPTG